MTHYELIKSKITGRIAILPAEAELIQATIKDAQGGNYLEIGTLWGGTAILAGLTYRTLTLPGHIWTVDPKKGQWWAAGKYDPAVGLQPHRNHIMCNLAVFGLETYITVVDAYIQDWIPGKSIFPTISFIDGDHSVKAVIRDFNLVKDITTRYILFHDYDSVHRGVKEAVDVIMQTDDDWQFCSQVETMVLLERKEHA